MQKWGIFTCKKQAIEKHIQTSSSSDVAEALALCTKNRLYGAQHFTDALKHFEHIRKKVLPPAQIPATLMEERIINNRTTNSTIKVSVRDMKVYQRIMVGGLQ